MKHLAGTTVLELLLLWLVLVLLNHLRLGSLIRLLIRPMALTLAILRALDPGRLMVLHHVLLGSAGLHV